MSFARYALAVALIGWPIAVGAGLQGCAWWGGRGRVVTTDCVHVGLRPAAACSEGSCEGGALTLQVTADPLVCRQVYPSKGTP